MTDTLYERWLWADDHAKRTVVKSRSMTHKVWLAFRSTDEVHYFDTFEQAIAWVTS
jgi:hypothetical protein